MAVPEPTQLLLTFSSSRRAHLRIFFRALLAIVAALGALTIFRELDTRATVTLFSLDLPTDLVPDLALNIGRLVAVALIYIKTVRGLFHLLLGIVRRSETVRLYNRGFQWIRGGKTYAYPWTALSVFREGARGLYLFNRPLLVVGATRLTMQDDVRFNFRPYLADGDPRLFTATLRRYAANVTSVRMGRTLRAERTIQLHRHLLVAPGGVEVKGARVRWADLEARVIDKRLVIRQRGAEGRFRTIRRFPLHAVDNIGGFLELAKGMVTMYRQG